MKTGIDNGDNGDNDGDQQHNQYQQVSPSITIMIIKGRNGQLMVDSGW